MSAADLADRIERLRALFPQAVGERLVEGRTLASVDLAQLRRLLGPHAADGEADGFGLHWPQRAAAAAQIASPPAGR
ncbi:MAG TPA: site-specific DNA-methyltransferase, partial [Plasticicumulans sp.]|nr:site-specific DNA-methyltransferase [Plasticicumulans sp.]